MPKKKKAKTYRKPRKGLIKRIPGTIKPSELAVIKRDDDKALLPDSGNLEKLGRFLFQSKLFPGIQSISGAVAIIEYGRELGLKPVQALQTMSIVKGRVCIEAKALLALAIQKGLTYKVIKSDENICKLEFSRPGFESHTETFTSDDAKRAKLTDKTSYVQYPKQMNLWRCVSNGVRAYAPDLALGLYSKEEMETEAAIEIPVTPAELIPTPESEEKEKNRKEMEAEKEELIKDIKYELVKNNIHPQDFKKFLEVWQEEGTKQPRTFVGYKFGNLSFHEGKLSDLKLLLQNLPYAINEFKKWWEKNKPKEEAKEPEPKEEL